MRKRIAHKDAMDALCFILAGVIVFCFIKNDNENTFIIKAVLFCLMTIILYGIIDVFAEFLDEFFKFNKDLTIQAKIEDVAKKEAEEIKKTNRLKISESKFFDYASTPSQELWGDFDDDF